ncbi:MAG: hypothetical protein JSR85_09100 [Proteobacteria bacterium]|nr:hypothetical protein [Pseudomonadota bacterium]
MITPGDRRIEVSLAADATIRVGNKHFKVVPVPGSIQATTHDLAQMALQKLQQCSQGQLKATADAKDKLKLLFTDSGTQVCRMDGRVITLGRSSGRSKPLFELHEVPPPVQRRADYWVKSLTHHMQAKGHSQDAISQVVESIFSENHLLLTDVMQGRKSSEWGEKTIADLLQEPGNEELRDGLLQLKQPREGEVSSTEFKQCFNDLKIQILKNIQRTPRVVELPDGQKMVQQFIQGDKHLADKIAREAIISPEDMGQRNKGYPSEADKGEYRREIINNNTNLGTVTTFDADNMPKRVVVVRSGKSDTIERLQEHVLEACMQQLSCKEPRGLVMTAPGTYEFQHAITTYLDPSRLKDLGETVVTGSGEAKNLKKLLEEVEKWPVGGIVVHLADDSGQLIQVTLKRPLIFSQLLSSTVRGVGTSFARLAPMGQKESDEINDKANLELLARYPTDKKIVDIRQFLLDEMKGDNAMLAHALYAIFYRKGMHAADLEILRNVALDLLNISKGKECKSGTDRTANGVALACAQEKFQITFNKTFNPLESHSKYELLSFKTFFREALKEMGISIVCETKGYSGIKWGGGIPLMGGIANPSAYKYLYLEEDLPHLRPLGIERAEPDVRGLTYDDLQKAGPQQYRGSLVDPKGFYGKSSKKYAEELEGTLERLSDSESVRKHAVKEVNSFFQEKLGLKEVQAVSDSLELAVHVRELKLDEPIVEGATRTRAEILKAYIEELQSRGESLEILLELYALKQINSLWELVHGAHTITVLKSAPFNLTPPGSPREKG